MKRFREDYEAPGLLRTIAQWMNDVGRFLNGINVVGNGHIEENARGSVTITVGRAGLSVVGGNITQAFSLFPKRLSDHLFACSGGMWFHKTALYEFSEQHFWTGAYEACPDGAIWISENKLPVCVYIEAPSKTWGYTTDFNSGLVGGTTYLRRSIFSIEFTVDGTPTNMITRNAGDIYS